MTIFASVLRRNIRRGTLELIAPAGSREVFGEGPPRVVWRFHNRRAMARIAIDPEFMLGQSYMDGAWDLEYGSLTDLLQVLTTNFRQPSDRPRWQRRLLRWAQPLQQWNRVATSRRNVATHYDLDETLFRACLDQELNYSCAYFESPGISLEEAQQAKCAHIGRKLLLEPGQSVLDIGCGWGSLALHLAEHYDVSVTGLTLSTEQKRVAEERIQQRGFKGRVRILLQDYREHADTYDRVVSVGMFEHVGVPYYPQFFETVRERLKPGGVALIHTIGRSGPPSVTNAWIRRYIFPGGYIPALSEIAPAIEPTGLVMTDVEILREHYANTLAAWQERFQAQREPFAGEKGEHFCRMWEFYLAASETAFRHRGMVVFQIQLQKGTETVVPVTRSYLYPSGAKGPPEPDRP